MSIKNFLLRKMLSSQMKGVSQSDQDKVFAMLEKNPDLFQKIGLEVEEEIRRTGADKMTVTMKVVNKYEADLKKLV